MMLGGSTDTDTIIVDWRDGTCTMVLLALVSILCLSIHVITYVVPPGCVITSRHPNKYTVVADR